MIRVAPPSRRQERTLSLSFTGVIKSNGNENYREEAGQNGDHDLEGAFISFESFDYLLVRDTISQSSANLT